MCRRSLRSFRPRVEQKRALQLRLWWRAQKTHHPLQMTGKCYFLNIYLQAEKGEQTFSIRGESKSCLYRQLSVKRTMRSLWLRHWDIQSPTASSACGAFVTLSRCMPQPRRSSCNVFNCLFLEVQRFKTMRQCVFYHVRYPFQVSTLARYIWCTWLRLVRYLTMARTKVKDSLIDGPLDCQGVQWKWIEIGLSNWLRFFGNTTCRFQCGALILFEIRH